jgi:uncharacterized Zn finger protein
VSRPRKPYGPNPPGRLLGTMVKVLAAEMSDQRRLARGKRYWADDAVIDIVVGHGAVTAEIQGSRQEPYVVTIEASGGAGVPGKREVWAQCTCPDDTGTGVDLCKHAVAAFFALADEITIEPTLVDRWRSSVRRARPLDADHDHDHDGSDGDDGDDGDELAQLPPADVNDALDELDAGDPDDERGTNVIELRPRIDADLDVISRLLGSPVGVSTPTFPDVDDLDHGPLRDRRLDEVLRDALDHLAIRWE